MSRVNSLIVGLTVGFVISGMIWRGVDWYEGNIQVAEASTIPCWEANWAAVQRREVFHEFDNRDPDDDPPAPDFGIFHCTEDGKFWALSTAPHPLGTVER